MKKNNFLWSFITVLVILSITGAVVVAKKINTPDESESLREKLRAEMNYLDGKISSMINGLNHIVLTNYTVEDKQITSQNQSSQSDNSAAEKSGSGSKEEADSSSTSEEEKKSSEESQNSQNKDPKNTTEMNYDSVLNNDETIDWEELKKEVENLQSSWPTVLLDLYKIDMNKEDILAFSDLLNQLTLNVKEEKKIESLDILTQMYSCIVRIHRFF